MKRKLIGISLVAMMMMLLTSTPPARAVDCSGDFSGNATITRCDAVPALNSFSSSGDHWGLYGRDLGTGSFSLYDDTAGSYPPDTLGIIKTGYTEAFFAAEDIDNTDNPGGGGQLELDFDISSLGSLQSIAIDMGAMGDFEAGDNEYTFSYQLDSGTPTTLFTITTDESVDPYTYTLESGAEVGYNDPLILAPTGSCADTDYLNNNLQTCTATISGSGTTLTLILDAAANNGGNEVFVFDKIVITGDSGSANAVVVNQMRAGNTGIPITLASVLLLVTGLVLKHKRR